MSNNALKNTYSILVNGVVFKKNHVLICQRSLKEPHEPGKWTIPGGKVETIKKITFKILEKTIKREVREETNVEIADKMQLITNNNFIRSTGQSVMAIVFACKYEKGELKALDDTLDCRWVGKSDFKNFDLAPNVQKYIVEAFEKARFQKRKRA